MKSLSTEPVAPPAGAPVIVVRGLGFRYGARNALDGLSLDVPRGALFGLLGPNGSGKTTFFRILSTQLRPGAGVVTVDGRDLAREADAVRERIGVVFQTPSLDPKLSVEENIRFHGWLFGIRGAALRKRGGELMELFGLNARKTERIETLSGGLKRRVELAKALLPAPPLLLLDEPSNGLDPAARLDFWTVLDKLRRERELTIVVATHLMDEADRCDRVALLDEGRLVAEDRPDALKRALGGDVLSLEAAEPGALAAMIRDRLGLAATVADGRVRVDAKDILGAAARLLEAFPDQIRALTLGRPTLEDVFLARTGHRLAGGEASS
jgi:ABC-2 type transport system ATP-binding protein